MNRPPKLDDAQAQLMMSQLLDGELSADDADRLHRYLEENPQAADWMETFDATRERIRPDPQASHASVAIASIQDAISHEEQEQRETARSRLGKLLSFPGAFRPLAAAAAVAIIGSVTWLSIQSDSSQPRFEPAVVEFVATDIPDASTFIYSDEESGWTVVWVESDPEPHG